MTEDEQDWLAERFEQSRGHLRGVAYRMLGSLSEADDAVQEAWLRLSRSDPGEIENLTGWLTTVVSHVCLDMLRSRSSRREDPLEVPDARVVAKPAPGANPEQETVLADSVGLALLVVLERLKPSERVAFVLHDMFAVNFEQIAAILGRSPAAARQLASRARRQVQGYAPASSNRVQQRQTVEAFLAALRRGDIEGLVAVLDPDVVVRLDHAAVRPGAPTEIRGAENWARGAVAFAQAARFVQPALVEGEIGLVLAPGGRLSRALRFTIRHGKITEVDVIADPARLSRLRLSVLAQ